MSIRLFVDGLPGSWTESDLRELVSPFGVVLSAEVGAQERYDMATWCCHPKKKPSEPYADFIAPLWGAILCW